MFKLNDKVYVEAVDDYTKTITKKMGHVWKVTSTPRVYSGSEERCIVTSELTNDILNLPVKYLQPIGD